MVSVAVIKTIPKKRKGKKEKWLSEEALQIAEKRRDMEGKGERERYTQINAEFQRIARRDKKAFFNEQCKEVDLHKVYFMGKTRYSFKKIGDFKGIFHTGMGIIIKGRSSKDLTEARIHRRTIRKKVLMTQIDTMVWSLT